jgi:methionyl aminopeptidase
MAANVGEVMPRGCGSQSQRARRGSALVSWPGAGYLRKPMGLEDWPNFATAPSQLDATTLIRTPDEIALMREAGHIVFEVLEALEQACAAGVNTLELDRLAYSETLKRKAKPAFKGYLGFPCSLCASVNDEVVHGIPRKTKVLADGDLMKLDFGVSFKGWFGDSARTVPIGKVGAEAQRVVDVTRQALHEGIKAARAGNRTGDVGAAVQRYVEAHGCSVVRDLTGHGIGRKLHEDPRVPNFGDPGTGMLLKAGMTIAIEPMVNAGTHKVEELDDDWTIVTMDHKLSAHFEHTILITEGDAEILTK